MVENDTLPNEDGIVLKKSRAKNQGGMLTNTVSGEGAVLPNAINAYRARAADLYQQGSELYNADPDMSQLQAFAKSRGGDGNAAMLNALAAQFAGENFQPVQAQYLKKAAAAQEPMKIGGGLLTSDGQFIKDPFAAQDKRAEFLLQQAKAYEQMALTAQTAQERMAAEQQYKAIMAGIAGMNAQTSRMNAQNGANRAPAGYQWTTSPDGAPVLTFIPGGPGDPAVKAQGGTVTEDERKAAGYMSRIQQGLELINGITTTNPTAAKPGVTASALSRLPAVGNMASNVITPEARQRVEAAQLDMLDAALTLATGAAYTKEQLQGLSKSYFPQLGDDPKTVADKEVRLRNIIETARTRAGRALTQPGAAAPAAANNDPLGLRR